MPRSAVVFILVTVMLDAGGVGLIIPVMPDLIREVNAGDLASAALWGGVLSTSFAVMQFLFGPLIGALSDRFGRRPVLLVSLVAMALDYVVMALAGSIWILLAGRIVGGITAATGATANAYMADISSPSERAANFGLIGAAFGIGFVLGPLLGGMLAEFGTRAPFWAAAGLAALNAGFGVWVLRETVEPGIRRRFDPARANPLGVLLHLRRLPRIGGLLGVFFLYQLAFMVFPSIWAFYGQARYGWSATTVGLSLAIFGILMALVQGGLIRWVLRRLGEARTVVAGHLLDIAAYVSLALAGSGVVALMLTPLAAFAAVLVPALQAMMSRAVGPQAQGELQGALTSLSGMAMIVSPMIMTGTFAMFSRAEAPVYAPGAPFVLSAVLMGAALLVFLRQGQHLEARADASGGDIWEQK